MCGMGLSLVMRAGSWPRKVQEEELRSKLRMGQSPSRWSLLVQNEQETDIKICSNLDLFAHGFQIRSQSSSRCRSEPQSSHGTWSVVCNNSD